MDDPRTLLGWGSRVLSSRSFSLRIKSFVSKNSTGRRFCRVTLLESQLEGVPKWQGKVRDVYDLGERLLLVATDRIAHSTGFCRPEFPTKGEF